MQALGSWQSNAIRTFSNIAWARRSLLLCTDGLTDMVDDDQSSLSGKAA